MPIQEVRKAIRAVESEADHTGRNSDSVYYLSIEDVFAYKAELRDPDIKISRLLQMEQRLSLTMGRPDSPGLHALAQTLFYPEVSTRPSEFITPEFTPEEKILLKQYIASHDTRVDEDVGLYVRDHKVMVPYDTALDRTIQFYDGVFTYEEAVALATELSENKNLLFGVNRDMHQMGEALPILTQVAQESGFSFLELPRIISIVARTTDGGLDHKRVFLDLRWPILASVKEGYEARDLTTILEGLAPSMVGESLLLNVYSLLPAILESHMKPENIIQLLNKLHSTWSHLGSLYEGLEKFFGTVNPMDIDEQYLMVLMGKQLEQKHCDFGPLASLFQFSARAGISQEQLMLFWWKSMEQYEGNAQPILEAAERMVWQAVEDESSSDKAAVAKAVRDIDFDYFTG